MSKTKESLSYWAECLAKRLIEMPITDLQGLKIVAEMHIKSALFDMLKVQVPETEKRLKQAQIMVNGGGNTEKIKKEILELKLKLIEERKLLEKLDKDYKLEEMARWMQKNHLESFHKFYEYYDDKFHSIIP